MLLLCVLLLGCREAESAREPLPLNVLPNNSAYASYINEDIGSGFSMNLRFYHDVADTYNITDITLLPVTDIVTLDDFNVTDLGVVNGVSLQGLGVSMIAESPGTHTFTDIEMTANGATVTLPLGKLRTTVATEKRAEFLSISRQVGGSFRESHPLDFTVENDSDKSAVVKDVLVEHPHIYFDAQDIIINPLWDVEPLPIEGLTIHPGESVNLQLDWEVGMPGEGPINMEARPLLVVEEEGELRFLEFINTIFRRDPAAPET
ncbi:MAG: hypothetical protein AAGF95_27755 [Chloroflexota bacterium]